MGIFGVVKKAKEKINEAMTRVHNRKNYTEKEDLTQKDVRELQEAKPVAAFTKIINKTLPDMALLVEENIDTDRVDGRMYYEDRTIVLTTALAGALGVPAVSGTSCLNTAEGITNFSYFCEQEGLTEIPNYQTITNALDKISDLDGFNNIYAGLYDKLDRSHRYDDTRPTVVFQGMRGEDGKFPLRVAKVTPVISDGLEVTRKQHRQSDQDLVYTFRDKEGNVYRTDYAQKFEVMVADLGTIVIPFCAEPIENEPGIDYTVRDERDTEKRKQTSETKVADEMVEARNKRWPGKTFLDQGDGLYLNRPFMENVHNSDNVFIVTFKEGCAPALFKTAMEEMERQRKEYAEGKLKTNPIQNVKSRGIVMQVQYVMDVGGRTGDPEWDPFPVNVLKATYQEHLVICNERIDQKIRTRKGIAEARQKNMEVELPDFTEEECREMFRDRYKQNNPKLTSEQIEEILEGVTFIQSRDSRTLCRIVTADVSRRFIWATNIVLNLDEDKTAKQLLMDKLLGKEEARDYSKMRDAKKYVSGFLGEFIYQARRRWQVEEVFGMIKGDIFKVGRKKRHNSYKVEKALFYITLLSWLFLELYRTYDKYAAKGLKKWNLIAERLRASFQSDNVWDEMDYMKRRTCYWPQLE